MQSQDLDVLRQALHWVSAEQAAWLCTVVSTVGSSPRPVGTILACDTAGNAIGSLSGGCVEEDLLARLASGEFNTGRPETVEYGVSADENERLGLPCGGRLRVLVQGLNLQADRSWLQEAVAALESRRCVLRRLAMNTGETRIEGVQRFAELTFDERELQQCFGPQMRMLLVGAGQLAQSLAELALAMDYQVLVTDPRAQALAQWQGPAVELIQGMPDDVVRQRADDPFAIIITLTHDPRIDDMALMEALLTEAWYVGALGSQKTTQKRLQRLRDLELPDAAIARLHAPVGLAIGSKTPVEIAVAIMAEITSLRRLR